MAVPTWSMGKENKREGKKAFYNLVPLKAGFDEIMREDPKMTIELFDSSQKLFLTIFLKSHDIKWILFHFLFLRFLSFTIY